MKVMLHFLWLKLYRFTPYLATFLAFTWVCYILVYYEKPVYVTEIQGWNNKTRSISYYVNRSSTLISPNLTHKEENKETISVLAVVASAPDNFAKRLAIRQTWKNELVLTTYKSRNSSSEDMHSATKTLRFQLIFQVGLHPSKNSINRKVIQETNDYGDVLLQDFYEHYTNLSVKSVMILKYFRENLKIKPDFLFKLDDDVFLNVAKINKIEAWNNHDSISGFVNAEVIPIRQAVLNDPLELYKWICPKWMFSGETYPNYTAGPAYIIPKDYINCLYQMAMKSSSKLYMEDIFITGILRDKCNIELKHEESFIWIDACTDPKNVTVIHHVNETDQHLYHKIFNMGENGTENMSLICKTARAKWYNWWYNLEASLD